jgi:hypothetical protein
VGTQQKGGFPVNDIIPYQTMEAMAGTIAKSNLFGIKRQEEALALMLVAQAEGRHPAIIARDYHIIQGRPALRAEAMMARFQEAGGRVEWLCLTDERAEAKFLHPQGSATISWDIERARKAELGGRDMWRKYPRQMLRSRVISEGIRTVFPGAVCGVYEVEETRDIVESERPAQGVTVTTTYTDPAPYGSQPEPPKADPAAELEACRVKARAWCREKGLPVSEEEIDGCTTVDGLRALTKRKPLPPPPPATTDFPGPQQEAAQ